MTGPRASIVVLAFLLLAAHFSRAGADIVAGLTLFLPLLLLVRRSWARWILRVALLLGGFEWLRTLLLLVGERRAMGEDWARLAVILTAVALVTFLAAASVNVALRTSDADPPRA